MALMYLQIFADKEELLEPFDDAEKGRLLTAMMAYALHDEEIHLTGNERFVWPVFRQMIDQSKAALDAKVNAGKARHSKTEQDAAEASSSQQESAESSTTQQEAAKSPIIKNQESRIKNQDTRNKNKGEGEKRTRFSPPSPADVDAYAKEQGINVVGQRFCDFYASKGWKVGGSAMKDWKAAARNWASRDSQPRSVSPPVKAVEQQQYSQRTYVHSEDAMDRMMAEYGGVT